MKHIEDLYYPFVSTKHLNPIGMNREPVHMSMRKLSDYEPLDKLNDPTKPAPLTKTKYELY